MADLLHLQTLLSCCCRRKRFMAQVAKHYNPCMLASLRGHAVANEALCLMLEWELIELEEVKMQIVTTLQTTSSGREHYQALCQRQRHLRELSEPSQSVVREPVVASVPSLTPQERLAENSEW
uniref:Uncharacterized protein n=1 Tax=Timema cristinae TaxID=61476 RepID=A0A7R9D1Q8_TIMCR|nr:unnamed protein product [Timema cristinae]